ncbi:acyl-CoA synthetase [Rhodococcus rhodnii]|uniref:CoA synthetase n=2 Tax=Rhodococcus rhodnii TaxID=38312 RepID=R7WIH5_9NOCA|nr:long-chain fatty acid--CoA ligase [Rhodococcus rhodnii]EOM74988.1 CoA synthetase [Rhodococcus rhodnii LMG 5362]TXG90249.1 acyl-CoA synthetase [Rhodococcus rhodnii]
MTSTVSSQHDTTPHPGVEPAPATGTIDLGSWIARRAAISPERPAITFDGETLTYRAFQQRIDRVAAVLAAGGVAAGDRVGYLGFNHVAFLESMLGAARIGAIFVPLNFRLTGSELAWILTDAGVHTLVADGDRAAIVDPALAETPVQRAIVVDDGAPGDRWESYAALVGAHDPITAAAVVDPSDVALIMYTSGTTGRPKGAMLTHSNFFQNNVNGLLAMDSSRDDVTLVGAPLFHIGGLNVTTLVTLQKGGHVVLMPAFDPAAALRMIAEHRITTMFGVPAMFLFMAQLPEFEEADLSSLRFLVCGGAPVPEPLIRRYGDRGIPFAQGYGLTETAPLALVMSVDETSRKIGAAGKTTCMLSDVRVVDPDGADVAVGQNGEVCVRGPQVMAGYWRNPEATARAIDEDGWFHTGDLGRVDEDGYVYVIDRIKDMIITGGENVYPAEVESVLYDHPAVAEVAVIGLPDDTWGESVTAVVATGGADLDLDDLARFARERLAGYKVPRRLEFVDALPRNPSGKILKFVLRENYS